LLSHIIKHSHVTMASEIAQPLGAQLTSTTAPGKIFSSRSELASHYKSDWHKYNLKRREAGMPMLTFEDFTIRFEAAMALRREREGREERNGRDHLKDKDNRQKKAGGKGSVEKKISRRQLRQRERNGDVICPVAPSIVDEESVKADVTSEEGDAAMEDGVGEEVLPPTIDPNQSLFDKHISKDVETNVEYMYEKYGFFLPDRECIIELEGLIGYCTEKVKLGHMCLYCQKTFKSWRGCQEHMINTRHTKLRYEKGIDLEEFDVFYDFSKDDEEFLASGLGNFKKKRVPKVKQNKEWENADMDENIGDGSDSDSGEWEDVDSDEDMEDGNEDGLYAAYQDEIANHGFDITPLGELIFPDGRIVGHRGLSRYYKQKYIPENSRPSVVAAKRANKERVVEGRVYDLSAHTQSQHGKDGTLQLVKAGLVAGAARGRSGHGILVNAPGTGGARGSSFTLASLYRFKAAVNKERKEEFRGKRLQERTRLPMNKMDKKANRLHNNVSVAHALR